MLDLESAIVNRLAAQPDVRLPSLTREELYALGDQPVLADAGDVHWWQALDQTTQEVVAESAQRSLIARNLLVPDSDGHRTLTVADEVQIILAARRAPSWLMVLGEPGLGAPTFGAAHAQSGVQIALTGIDLRAHQTAAVLISARIQGIYAHRLVTPALAMDEAAIWLTRAPTADQGQIGRSVETILPAEAEPTRVGNPGQPAPTRRTRALVLSDENQWVLAVLDPDGSPGQPSVVQAATLRARLVDFVAGLAQV
jgi:hypothetical protein